MVSRFLVSMLLAAFTATQARAATFTVTSLADGGPGTLREAIAQANILAGPDRVVFAVTGTLTLTSGEIAITDSVEIVGPGADSLTITPSSFGRIFNIAPATEVTCLDTEPPDAPTTLSGLTLAAGYGYGWGGGAILTFQSLLLSRVRLRDNVSDVGGAIALYPRRPGQVLRIADSTIERNKSDILSESLGGANGFGGGLAIHKLCIPPTPLSVTIERTTWRDNVVDVVSDGEGFPYRGGAMMVDGDVDLHIADSRIVDNRIATTEGNLRASASGGGVSVSTTGRVLIERTEVAGNAAGLGGGIHFVALSDTATLTVTNSTISGNTGLRTPTFKGIGGIAALGPGKVSIHNVTIAGNLGGGLLASAATHVLTSSIFAAGPDTLPSIESTSPVTVLADHSLVELPCASCNLTFAGIGNLIGVSPGLLPLADNGGSTRTHSLSSTSPARDKGRNPLSFSTDQRGSGHPRIVGTRADIGAFESPDPPADCAGFVDVPGTSPFCAHVDWVRNRGITVGCQNGAHYCPEWAASRLAMAAFTRRLGRAIETHVEQWETGFLGSPGLPVSQPTLCSMPISPTAVSVDSRAHMDLVVSLLSSMTLDVGLQLKHSLDGGGTWQSVHALPRKATLQAGQWESVRLSGDIDIAAPSTPLFNVELVPSAWTGPTLEGAYCRHRIRLQSRSDAALPIRP